MEEAPKKSSGSNVIVERISVNDNINLKVTLMYKENFTKNIARMMIHRKIM